VKKWNWKGGWLPGSFILGCGFILFFNLWARTLENHGYLRYAEVAREMIRSGEWGIPHLNGKIFIDKPPLLFWLIAIPASLHGSVTPLIARLPSDLSAWATAILAFFWARRVYRTDKAGLISGGILLSCYQFFFQARLEKTDMLLCFCIVLSLYFFQLGYEEHGRRQYFFHGLSFFSMGLGVLTKGPFGLFMPLLVMAVFLARERQWRIWVSKPFLLGYMLSAFTVLPWIFLFIHRVGLEESIRLMKETDILTREAPFYFYSIQIWGQFFPWSLLLPFLFFKLWKQRREFWHSRDFFFITWFVVIFIALTFFKYRTSRYLLPALPPLALVIGGVWKKNLYFFLVPFFLFVLIWHGVEINWIRKDKDLSHSQGMALAGELRPFIKESTLFGFQLDVSTQEEINFYLDRVIPQMNKKENLLKQIEKKEGALVLMPREVYEDLQMKGDHSMTPVKGFSYKKGRLILVTYLK
jgi:4-amino-4-deoxy-L-arabinose transferase-like glycosyltransferase